MEKKFLKDGKPNSNKEVSKPAKYEEGGEVETVNLEAAISMVVQKLEEMGAGELAQQVQQVLTGEGSKIEESAEKAQGFDRGMPTAKWGAAVNNLIAKGLKGYTNDERKAIIQNLGITFFNN